MALTDKLKAIADAIRGKTGGTEELTLDQMATEIAGIEAGGGDNPLDYATSQENLFSGASFPETLEIVFGKAYAGTTRGTTLKTAFFGATTKNLKVDFGYDVSSCDLNSAFRNCSAETLEIPFAENSCVTNWNRAFQSMGSLKKIKTPLNFGAATNVTTIFASCVALEELWLVPESLSLSINIIYSGNLTDESIQSIIDGLADLTGGTAQTLTLHATVGAKLTDEQKAAASAKNWTITY